MPHKSRAVIDRPYSVGHAAVGALYERSGKMPSYSCALPKRPCRPVIRTSKPACIVTISCVKDRHTFGFPEQFVRGQKV
jgi:hypothetical protein